MMINSFCVGTARFCIFVATFSHFMPLYSDHYTIPFLTVIRMSTVRIYYNSCWTMWSQINWKHFAVCVFL